MSADQQRQRTLFSWLFLGATFVLCAVLGVLQYRWIGEVNQAARDRLRGSLQASLTRLSVDFNSEIAAESRALEPQFPSNEAEAESGLRARFEEWNRTTRHSSLFQRVALAIPQDHTVSLRGLNLRTGALEEMEWPAEWSEMKAQIEARAVGEFRGRGGPPDSFLQSPAPVFEFPLFRSGNRGYGRGGRFFRYGFAPARPAGGPPDGGGRPPMFQRPETGWIIFELNREYVASTMIPELIQRYLGTGGNDYQVEIVTRSNPPTVIHTSDPGLSKAVREGADASVYLFDPQIAMGGDRGMRGPAPGPGPSGRWQLFVRHRAGSLEAVVSRANWRTLAVTGGVLLLMLATAAALVKYTRRAQNLAELQMDFVAGVSHELRTPLTVIHTAAYNLRGKIATNPAQVERYGALIQQESGRLKDLVEQVLQFSSAKAGRVMREPEPLSVENLIEESMKLSATLIQDAECVVEKFIEPDLPRILGDPVALKHAIQNLIGNAAKYGAAGNWIGVFAARSGSGDGSAIEIRVADHGAGIPADEREHVFDPFFRGKRALQDQIHGTGLGLNLVKRIVEAHGGTIRVQSEETKGTEFIMRLPAPANGAAQ